MLASEALLKAYSQNSAQAPTGLWEQRFSWTDSIRGSSHSIGAILGLKLSDKYENPRDDVETRGEKVF